MTDPPRPLPIEDELAAHWLAAAAEGQLLIQRCPSCERFQYYPRTHCVHCHALEVRWHRAAGTGRLHSFSIVRHTPNREFAADCPYALALVELTEGVRVTSRLVDCELDTLRCEQPVHVVFCQRDGVTLPMFTPTGSEPDR